MSQPVTPGVMPRVDIGNGVTVPIAPVTPALEGALGGIQGAGWDLGKPPAEPPPQPLQGPSSANAVGRSDAERVAVGLGLAPPPPPPAAGAAPQQGDLYNPNSAPGGAGTEQPSETSYPPARWVPGKMTPQSEVTEYGPKMSEEAAQKVNESYDTQRKLAEASAQLALNKANAESLAYAKQTADTEAELQRRAQAKADQDKAVAEVVQRSRQLREERRAKVAEMGPNRFFRNIGTVPTILAAITRGVGAFAASMPGGTGTNYAGDVIDDAIERDMQSQRNEIDAVDGDLDQANNELANLYRIYGDKEQAEREFFIMGQDIAKQKFDQAMRADLPDEIKMQLEQAKADIDVRQAQHIGLQEEQVGRRAASVMTQGHTVGGAPSTAAQLAEMERQKKLYEIKHGEGSWDRDRGNKSSKGNYVEGFGEAANPQAAQKATEGIAAYNDLMSAYAELKRLKTERPQGWETKFEEVLKTRVAPKKALVMASGFNPSAEKEKQAEALSNKYSPLAKHRVLSPSTWLTDSDNAIDSAIESDTESFNANMKALVPGSAPRAGKVSK